VGDQFAAVLMLVLVPPTQSFVAACALPASATSIPATSATPAATDNRFPIVDNHPRFLLPVCFLMRFVSCLGFCFGRTGQTCQTGLTELTELTDFSLQPSALNLQLFRFQFSAFQLFSISLQLPNSRLV
jgi:hypothetical protein